MRDSMAGNFADGLKQFEDADSSASDSGLLISRGESSEVLWRVF